jgi:hypothetical protein
MEPRKSPHKPDMRIGSPAGKTIADAGAGFFRMAIGKVAEGWVLGDLLSLLRQLGAQKLP